jgi:hypothetical protein
VEPLVAPALVLLAQLELVPALALELVQQLVFPQLALELVFPLDLLVLVVLDFDCPFKYHLLYL